MLKRRDAWGDVVLMAKASRELVRPPGRVGRARSLPLDLRGSRAKRRFYGRRAATGAVPGDLGRPLVWLGLGADGKIRGQVLVEGMYVYVRYSALSNAGQEKKTRGESLIRRSLGSKSQGVGREGSRGLQRRWTSAARVRPWTRRSRSVCWRFCAIVSLATEQRRVWRRKRNGSVSSGRGEWRGKGRGKDSTGSSMGIQAVFGGAPVRKNNPEHAQWAWNEGDRGQGQRQEREHG